MTPIRMILVGGFLGAGKTTTIACLAKAYQTRGLRVGIVMNDQAEDLVDTHALRSQGFDVGEVAGACFCCNFSQLTKTVEAMRERVRPDVVLAEPVGSCADLAATVLRPLVQLFPEQFSVAPYGVILKPSHGRRILGREPKAGFSPQAAYIFRKQLEEADFLIVNRIDELPPAEVTELEQLLQAQVPGTPILRASARTGAGFDAVLAMLDQTGQFGTRLLELDYDIYAEGEAELGWLNSRLNLTSRQPFSLDDMLVRILTRLQQTLVQQGAEIAHLKAIGLWEGYHGVANLISSDTLVELSIAANCETQAAEMIVNARVATSPELLQKLLTEAIQATCDAVGAVAEICQSQSFRPARPIPTHRFDVNGKTADS